MKRFPIKPLLTLLIALSAMGGRMSAESLYPSYNVSPLAADESGVESNAIEIASRIKLGWNLGNTLEAIGGETAWGNPEASKELIALVKASGFDAIRLPTAWDQYSDPDTGEIDAAWLARVEEVVQYCVDEGLYVILNIHWDGGWLENNITEEKQEANNAKQKAFWEQIATHFRDFDEHLLFAGTNEPNAHDATQMGVLLSYLQTFVDAVRSTGGKNAYRVLIVQGPATDIEETYELMDTLPSDTVDGRMMAEIHFYTPYNFTLMTEDQTWGKQFYYWGEGNHSETDTERNATWGEEDLVNELFGKMKEQFVEKGVPVVLGEFCASRRTDLEGESLELHLASRAYYHRFVTERANALGLLPFYWDMGALGNHSSGIFDRDTNSVFDETTLDALQEGALHSYWSAFANSDGDWANDLMESLLGSDPYDPLSAPIPPALSWDEEGRAVLTIHRFANVLANWYLLGSSNLRTWSLLSVAEQENVDTSVKLVAEEADLSNGPLFVRLGVSL